MTPTPRRPARGKQGHANGRFLRKLTMVCFISLVVSGLIVYWIGQTPTPQRAGDRLATAHPSQRADHWPPAIRAAPGGQRPAPARTGGDGCG